MPRPLRLATLILVANVPLTGTLFAAQRDGAPAQMGTAREASATSGLASPVPAVPTAAQNVIAPSSNTVSLPEAIKARLGEDAGTAAAGTGPVSEERQALATFYASRNHAPQWLSTSGLTARGEQVMAEIGKADSWGLSPAELALPSIKSLAAPPSTDYLAGADLAISRAALRYARQARGGRIDPLQLSNALDRKPPLLEPAAVLDALAKAEHPELYLRSLHPQHVQFQRLRTAWLALRTAGKDEAMQRRLLINMEQWRWMPDDLGALHIVANVPEFMLRVVKDGTIVHTERMIAGLPDKQTPVFSADMTTVTFHPQWGVPNSIKVKEILPGLLRGKSVLTRHNLKIAQNGREVDATAIDWTKADIRSFHVYQPGGSNNVLGVVKFSFPNKHDVYMHDTPTKNLFNAASRTFSHGCLRVRDPLKLAHVLLEADKGWPMSRVTALAGPGGGQNHAVQLARKVPVHATYFTAVVDEAGKVTTYPDPYGHERRIQMGLDGKAHLIAKTKQDLTAARAEVIARLGDVRVTRDRADWKRDVFSSN